MEATEMLRVLTELNDKRTEVLKESRSLILARVAEFLAKNPTVEQVRWAQYIPSFNDGEPCLFRHDDVEVKFFGEEDFRDQWGGSEDDAVKDAVVQEAQWILDFVMSYEILESAFPPGSLLTFSREGLIEEQEYYE